VVCVCVCVCLCVGVWFVIFVCVWCGLNRNRFLCAVCDGIILDTFHLSQ